MKFTNLDQVIDRWAERYAVSKDRDDLLATPGYSEEAIAALEQKLGIEFHSSFRRVLLHINLDTVNFRRLTFGFHSGESYLQSLSERNIDDFLGTPLNERTIFIAGGEGDFVILSNLDGSIAAGDHELRFEEFSRAADNMEQFLCLLATIIDETEDIWRSFKTRQEAVEVSIHMLDQLGVTQYREILGECIARHNIMFVGALCKRSLSERPDDR